MHTSLITGGGRGIGRAIALALAEPDRHVIVAGRHKEALVDTAAEIERRGARATTLQIDVTDEHSVSTGLASLQGTSFALDVLVNNAGTSVTTTTAETRGGATRLTSTSSACI